MTEYPLNGLFSFVSVRRENNECCLSLIILHWCTQFNNGKNYFVVGYQYVDMILSRSHVIIVIIDPACARLAYWTWLLMLDTSPWIFKFTILCKVPFHHHAPQLVPKCSLGIGSGPCYEVVVHGNVFIVFCCKWSSTGLVPRIWLSKWGMTIQLWWYLRPFRVPGIVTRSYEMQSQAITDSTKRNSYRLSDFTWVKEI